MTEQDNSDVAGFLSFSATHTCKPFATEPHPNPQILCPDSRGGMIGIREIEE